MDITVPDSRVPVQAECDVLVCGGGTTGVVAAVAAARHGAKVVLLERWPCVGGMATAALVTCWHRSDREKLVIYGLVEEAADRMARRGWIRFAGDHPRCHETHWFDPEGMKIVLQEMLDEAGVRVFCYTPVGEPLMEGGRIRGILADTKRGRRAFLGKVVVDSTGDGDVAAKAGVPFDLGRPEDGRVQGMSMMYRVCGIDDARVAAMPPEEAARLDREMRAAMEAGELPVFSPAWSVAYAYNRVIPNMAPASGNPLDEEELSRLTAQARRNVHAYWDWMRERVPGVDGAAIEQTGWSLGVRESRRVRGRKTLDKAMVLGAVKQGDAVGHGVWMVDIHDPKGSGYTTWIDRSERSMLRAGTSYHIPLGMCLNDNIANLAVAGRCASSTHEAHSSVRVMSHCMVMGQGVGAAAAMALDRGCDMAALDVRALQAALRADGVYLEDVPQM